jgi:hypothetical protein
LPCHADDVFREAGGLEMRVGIDQPGNDGLAGQIDDTGSRADRGFDRCAAPRREYLAVENGQRFHNGGPLVHGQDFSVDQNQIRRTQVGLLCVCRAGKTKAGSQQHQKSYHPQHEFLRQALSALERAPLLRSSTLRSAVCQATIRPASTSATPVHASVRQ